MPWVTYDSEGDGERKAAEACDDVDAEGPLSPVSAAGRLVTERLPEDDEVVNKGKGRCGA